MNGETCGFDLPDAHRTNVILRRFAPHSRRGRIADDGYNRPGYGVLSVGWKIHPILGTKQTFNVAGSN